MFRLGDWGRTMLLRSVSKHVKDQNWFAVALDFFIVVAGILIAFQITNWNEARSMARAELIMLDELHAGLIEDVTKLDAALERRGNIKVSLERAITHLKTSTPYKASLDADFGAVYGLGTFTLDHASYDSLKSLGHKSISNRALRREIIELYESAYPQAEYLVQFERDVMFDLLRPQFLAKFSSLQFTRSATPIDYTALTTDTEFINVLEYRLQSINKGDIPAFEEARATASKLIKAIEAETGVGKRDAR